MLTRDRLRDSIGILLLAAALAAPAAAEELFQIPLYPGADMTREAENYVEIGIVHSSEDSYKFGEFTGLEDKGAHPVVNLRWTGALAGGSGWTLRGRNLGLPAMTLGFGFENQSRWFFDVGIDRLTRYEWQDTRFLHTGLGGSTLTLPVGFTGIGPANGSQPPANSAAIDPFLTPFAIEQGRDVWRIGGGVRFAGDWEAELDLSRISRDGNRLIGAVIGNSGGNPRSAILPYDIDDATDKGDAIVRYTGQRWQMNLAYHWSSYDSDADFLRWANPYAAIGGWAAAAGFPTGEGLLELYPSNDFKQLQATGGFDLAENQRITATVALGWLDQDEPFKAYSVNPGLVVTTPRPRSSLDGQIDQTLVDVSYWGRPIEKLTLRANVHFSEHDNGTPQAQYLYIGGDSQDQDASPVGSSRARVNIPIGTSELRLRFGADYEVAKRLFLKGQYEYKKIDYEPAAIELRTDTDNSKIDLELRRVVSPLFSGAVKYTMDRRRGSDFSGDRVFRGTHEATYVSNARFVNLPTIRPFHVSDYDRDAVRLYGDITPHDAFAIQLAADWFTIDHRGPDCGGPNDQVISDLGFTFPSTCAGRTEVEGSSWTVDFQWTPRPSWSAFAFYTSSVYENEQTGRQYVGAPSGTKWAQSTDPTRNWTAELEYTDDMIGIGAQIHLPGAPWDGGVHYIVNDGSSETTLAAGTGLTAPGAVPESTADLDSIQAWARWKFRRHLALRFNYWRQKLEATDWAFDGATPTSSNNVLLAGQTTPQYTSDVFAVSFAWSR